MAKLELKITGVRGNAPQLKEVGQVVLFADNPENGCYIVADAYVGQGAGYTKRDVTNIQVRQDYNILFSGTFEELCEKLKQTN